MFFVVGIFPKISSAYDIKDLELLGKTFEELKSNYSCTSPLLAGQSKRMMVCTNKNKRVIANTDGEQIVKLDVTKRILENSISLYLAKNHLANTCTVKTSDEVSTEIICEETKLIMLKLENNSQVLTTEYCFLDFCNVRD